MLIRFVFLTRSEIGHKTRNVATQEKLNVSSGRNVRAHH
jgi:hypothetical protein